MKLHNLVVLYGQVVTGSFQMGDLHEEAGNESLPDVQVIIPGAEVRARSSEVESVHDPGQLRSHLVCTLQRPVVDEVVVTPLGLVAVLLERVEDVQKGEVVAVDVSESHLGFVRLLPGFGRPDEALRNGEHRGDGEDFVGAIVVAARDDHLGELRIERKLCHHGTQFSQLSFVVYGRQVVQKFEGPHERLWSRRIHEVKVDEIVYSELLQLENHGTQVRPQNLGVRVILHFVLVRLFRVQSEALSGPGTTGSAGPLLSAGLADGSDQKRFHSNSWVVNLLLGKSSIDDKDDSVYGKRCLCNVG